MINRIPGIQNPALQQLAEGMVGAVDGKSPKTNENFAQMLMDALKDVNASQADARRTQEAFMAGRQQVDIADLKIALEKASISMQLTMAVRNKILEAYQEISRMQV